VDQRAAAAGSRSHAGAAAGGTRSDLLALVRSIGFAGRVPAVRRRARDYLATYEEVIAPIIRSTVDDPARRAHVAGVLRSAGVKLCFLIAGYAAMARIPLRVDLGVLAGAITRAYDDLLDDVGGDELDRRLAELFRGGSFHPANDLERLFHGLYREVERRLDRRPSDPIFAALRRLHEFQVRSRRQRDPRIPAGELDEITRGKGAYGTVVLLALTKPGMGEEELALLRELGAVLQQLDDCQDVELDRRAGVTTAATRGQLTLGDICRRLRELAPALRQHYGRVRPLYAVVYVYLWFCFVRRRWPGLGTEAGRARTPVGILLRPGDNLGQRAKDRHEP
jgi:hypothetical protein